MNRSLTAVARLRRPAAAPAHLALNLSYVLHAPSTSAQVAHLVRGNQRAAKAVAGARDHLSGLDDATLRRAIVICPRAAIVGFEPDRHTLSLRLGAWELLPRALGVVVGTRPRSLTLLDDPSSNLTPSEFFRGSALLNLPPDSDYPCRFATLICRPGYSSLLLNVVRVDSPADLTRQAEDAVRRFVDQWRCVRALWDAPAEAVLPELTRRS